jgi:hypothetical protein
MVELDYWWEIDPVEVAASVNRRLLRNERMRVEQEQRSAAVALVGKPDDPWPDFNSYFDGCERIEREHYAKVRIVHLPLRSTKNRPYYLMYGDDDVGLTGGFSTIQKAALWFVYDGR